jgi:hypothetical protein
MSDKSSNGELNGLVEELKAVTDDAQETFGALSATQLNWKPSAEQWSVAQVFEHLIKSNRGFYPALEQTASGARRGNLWERVSPLSGFFGRMVLRAIVSPRKFPAPRALKPSASDIEADIIARFAGQQDELADKLRATEGADLRKTVVTSPISAFVTYSMLDACRIVVAHERRHFAQAQRVTESEGFPR